MRRVLIIGYHFPPTGTGGVGRALGWARHLPSLGWDVTVLSAPPQPNWPRDPTLLNQIPESVTVHRIAAADPRPDRFRSLHHKELTFLWFNPALQFARELLKRESFDVILATAPPPAAHRLAAHLGREFDVPWIADFRDPWGVRAPSVWRRWRRNVYVQQATGVVAVNDSLRVHLERALNREAATVFNGFEPDEMPDGIERVPKRAVYLGTLSGLNTLDGFYKALALNGGEFLHIGSHRNHDLSSRALAAGLEHTRQTGYLPRALAIAEAATGSVFILSLNPELNLALPAKTFDYIGLGGPLLYVGGPGAASDFLQRHELGMAVPAHDLEMIAEALHRLWQQPRALSPEVQARFSRDHQVLQMSDILHSVVRTGSRT
jgi:glycosyltransferase involved in cell wall biosynthesis